MRTEFVTANNERIAISDADQWVSMNPAVTTVTQTGLATGVAVGTAVIQGTYRGFTASGTVTVVSVATVEVSLPTNRLMVGQTTQATAVLKNARGNVVTGPVISWRADGGSVSVSSSGVVTGVRPGLSQVVAIAEGQSGSADVTVVAPVETVRIVPATLALSVGAVDVLSATGSTAAEIRFWDFR